MNSCTIENFSVNVLAPSHVRKAYASYEWIPLHTGGKKLIDLKGKKNLYIKCANCGCEITASGLCPDCGNDDFYIEELMERRLVECPDLRVRITNAGFLKIDIPDSVKKSHIIKYTFDGSQPCHTSPEWKPGTKVPPNAAKVSVCLFGKGTKSAIITVNHKEKQQAPSPPKSSSENFSCFDCGETVVSSGGEAKCIGCGADYHRVGGQWKQGKKQEPVTCEICSNSVYIKSSAFTCSKCGAKHQFNSGTKKWNCLGIPHKCELCGASITLSKSKTKCPKCSAEYDISGSGSISYKDYAVVKCICGKSFRATSTSLSECEYCHKKYEFTKGVWNEKKKEMERGFWLPLICIILIVSGFYALKFPLGEGLGGSVWNLGIPMKRVWASSALLASVSGLWVFLIGVMMGAKSTSREDKYSFAKAVAVCDFIISIIELFIGESYGTILFRLAELGFIGHIFYSVCMMSTGKAILAIIIYRVAVFITIEFVIQVLSST